MNPVSPENQSLEEQKKAARARLRQAAATVESPRHSGSAIFARLINWATFTEARTVMMYFSMSSWEPDLFAAGSQALLDLGVRVCLPRVNWEAGTMEACQVRGTGDLVRGRLIEPKPEAPIVPITELDVILVPGLGFDVSGGRLGRGGGFYDRFLSGIAGPGGRAEKACGIAFEAQVVERVPMGPMDIRMGAVATEARLIHT
jgi:5-formyltetrahydrofolate cyclo-ligase